MLLYALLSIVGAIIGGLFLVYVVGPLFEAVRDGIDKVAQKLKGNGK